MHSSNPIRNAPNLNHAWTALLAEELARNGVTDVFAAPGSRSTPLVLAVAQHPKFRVHVHFDERGAAFAALGWARASERAAALVCTSGSAVANCLPAVVEASQARIPLLLLTADRPPELLDCGANQAIPQPNIFDPFLRWAANMPCPDLSIPSAYVLSTIDQAVHRTQAPLPGPVHLNCKFREPLAPVETAWPSAWLSPLAHWFENTAPHTQYYLPRPALDAFAERTLLALLAREQQGLLLIGQLQSAEAQRAAAALADRAPWPVFADITSSLRTGLESLWAVGCYDQILLDPALGSAWRPEFILHIGGPLTSKRLNQQVRAWAESGTPIIHVADHALRHDPDHIVTHRFTANLAYFCEWLAPIARPLASGPQASRLKALDGAVATVLAEALDGTDDLNEMSAARRVSQLRPEHTSLFLGNSMPIRDMDMYADPSGPPGTVFANRGASGIDGNIATLAGIALATRQAVTGVMGDLAALHDLNALALLQNLGTPLVLIVINNDGGGIFSFLPVAESTPHFERLFGTPHGLGFQHAANLFGLAYAAPQTLAEFSSIYRHAIDHAGTTLIEVRTSRAENQMKHAAIQARVRAALEAMPS